MGKRKQPERGAAAGAAAPAPPPPRLGDHSSYMPEALLPLADVHIKVKGGMILPAHAVTLVQHCGALARSSELFAAATSGAPVPLGSPFDEYGALDVDLFLRCIYTAAVADLPRASVTEPAVVRLAHALDAAALLAAARRCLRDQMPSASLADVVAADELAALCGWDEIRAKAAALVAGALEAPPGIVATSAQLALSDAGAFAFASRVMKACPLDLAARVFGAVVANSRRLHALDPAAARGSALDPAAAAAALAAAGGAARELDGRVVALLRTDRDETESYAAFRSHGVEFELALDPWGSVGSPRVGLQLRDGRARKVRYQRGLVNLRGEPPLECEAEERVLPAGGFWTSDVPLPVEDFRDSAAGWVVLGRAAPFVRILEVSDPTPEELAAEVARRA